MPPYLSWGTLESSILEFLYPAPSSGTATTARRGSWPCFHQLPRDKLKLAPGAAATVPPPTYFPLQEVHGKGPGALLAAPENKLLPNEGQLGKALQVAPRHIHCLCKSSNWALHTLHAQLTAQEVSTNTQS